MTRVGPHVAEREAFLEDLRGATEAAFSATAPIDEHVTVAGTSVRLRFASEGLREAHMRALAHVCTPPVDTPALTVSLWDTATTGVPVPPPRWDAEAFQAKHGAIRGFNGDGLHTLYDFVLRSLTVLDTRAGEGWFWMPDAGDLTYLQRAAPLRLLFHFWIAANGAQLVHSACVAGESGCGLIVGESGRGKSSTALSCLLAGMGYVGDDYCVLHPADPPRISTIYNSGKVLPEALERLPGLRPFVVNDPAEGKALFFAAEQTPAQITAGAELRAVIVPRVASGDRTRARPAEPGETLAALAPSTLLQLSASELDTLGLLGDVVQRVPCHHLDLGTDPAGVAAAVAEILG